MLVAPINTQLYAVTDETPDDDINALIDTWAKRHMIRSACGTAALLVASYAVVI